MSPDEIAETFILAAEIERKMPRAGEKPAGYGGYVLQWVRTYEDKLNWRKEIGDHLFRGDDPLAEERQAFTDGRSSKVTAEDVSLWEKCLGWTRDLLDDPRERRALWAWAFARAGGRPFGKWCQRIEHISRETGRRRKDRAIDRIFGQLARGDVQNIENGGLGVLQIGGQIGDSTATVGDDAGRREEPNFWSADASFKSFIPIYDKSGSVTDMKFSARAARNALRRAKEAADRRAMREAEEAA